MSSYHQRRAMKGGPIPFGNYQLVDRINVGGMAEVFMAKAFGVAGFQRLLAIKRILPNMADDDEFINMFVDEARIAVQLSHANIVQVYELGKYEGQYYIAMEYVSGKDLRQLLDAFRRKQRTLPVPAAAYLASKICDGLDYAHRKCDPIGRPLNVIHRDVSPQNILVSFEGAAKITDFGIAKAEDRASKTQAGVLKGKFGYMSPEQVRGLEIDHRSDIFAVGILLYEMVTGKRLFVGESDFSTLEKVRNAEVAPPRELNPGVPEALEKVILKALAKEREERYGWASDLQEDLQQFLIEENSIYNAKRLAALLKSEFPEDIERERQRLEEFMHVPLPSKVQGERPLSEVHGALDVRGEKTMIFESAGFAEADPSTAPTTAGIEFSQPQIASDRTETSSVLAPAERDKSQRGELRNAAVARPSLAVRLGLTNRNRLGVAIVGLSLLLAAIVLIAVLVGVPPASVGTLLVTAKPDDVEVYLDEQLIGTHAPMTRSDVPLGRHTLRARARGYVEKWYRFELEGPGTAVIDVKLDPVASAGDQVGFALGNEPAPGAGGDKPAAGSDDKAQPPAGGALVEVLSEPSEARVKLGGIPQGVTPLTLVHADGTKPLVFEVSKPDYQSVTETVILKPNEQKRRVLVKLQPVSPSAAGSAKLRIRSSPDGAVVFSGSNRLGVTPLEIPGLDSSKSYSIRLSKDGYRDFETTVIMQGRSEVVVTAELERERQRERERDRDRDRKHTSATAAGCSGSGSKLSVMARGVADCKVTVGRMSLGVAPLFNKEAPVGRCQIVVSCPDGKRYVETRVLKAGAVEKLVIEQKMWK